MRINWPQISVARNQMKVIDYQSSKILEQPPSQNSGGKNLKEGFEAQEIRRGYLEKNGVQDEYPSPSMPAPQGDTRPLPE